MAQRKYEQFQFSLEKEVVTLHANIPIGATGAVGTLVASKNQGIKSVVRNSAGNYTITLGNATQGTTDKYQRLINCQTTILLSTVSAAVSSIQLISEDVLATGTFVIQFVGPTNSSTTTPIAVDPDSGAIILLSVRLKNSTV